VDALRGRVEDAARRLAALVSDERALPRHRIDAAFDLASLDRAHGQFREAARVLESLESLLKKEKVREAMALSTRGGCFVEIGDLQAARPLIEKAVRQSPGVPTRYLFARGLLELREGKLANARSTAAKILEGALPPENPSRTAEKASAYLTGMAWLADGQFPRAIDDLSRAVTLSGYEYAIYRLGLARAYLAAGKLPEALAAARQSLAPLNPADPRLDLELDRARAGLLLAGVHARMGQSAEAVAGARSFLDLWAKADRGLPDLAEARTLAGSKSTRAPS
jgi:tetratricopeptide (TPR) repeat protein